MKVKFLIICLIFSFFQLSAPVFSQNKNVREIIEKAAERRLKVKKELKSYMFSTYTKSISRNKLRSKNITMIYEYHTQQYFFGDKPMIEYCGFRQAGKRGVEWNPDLLNVYLDNRITIGKTKFMAPLSEDTFRYYNFKLLGTITFRGLEIFEIEVHPNNDYTPFLYGKLLISKTDYSIAGLEFTFKNVRKTGLLLNTMRFTLKQQFAVFYDKFWLPVNQNITGEFHMKNINSVFGFKGICESTIIVYDHKINTDATYEQFLADSRELKEKTKQRNSEHWSLIIGDLTNEEKSAFKELEAKFVSIYELNKQFGRY